MNIVEQVRMAGVVGAGGAGFPTHVKLNARAEVVIANGAECEPLLRVDQLLMKHRASLVVEGMNLAMEATGAKRGVIATKAHYHDAVEALKQCIANQPHISLHLMESYYPSGDEKSMIFEVTGKVVPSAKLPLDVGCVVCNVATLANIAKASSGEAVVEKDVAIGGDVPTPMTLTVPVGTSIQTCLSIAGVKASTKTHTLIVGGPCMGKLEENWDAPITKTTGGLLLLSNQHPLILKRTMPLERQRKLAQAVCCQCNQCTVMCPRNALGLHVQPHKAMRALTTGKGALLGNMKSVLACSSCGLCTNYACNMGLSPSEMMASLKMEMGKQGIRPTPEENIVPSPFVALKRVPVKRLVARMGLTSFDVPAPYVPLKVNPSKVQLLLRQHVGKPSVPTVSVGDWVTCGDLIADIPEKSLGATLHASISGKVTAINDQMIEITRGEKA